MLDHVTLNVSDLETSRRFFEQALQPLGYRILFEVEGFVGMGAEHPDFGFAQRGPEGVAHVAFASPDRATVDACYEAALAAGGRDNGAPASARTTTRTTTRRSSSIPTATTSRWSAPSRKRRSAAPRARRTLPEWRSIR